MIPEKVYGYKIIGFIRYGKSIRIVIDYKGDAFANHLAHCETPKYADIVTAALECAGLRRLTNNDLGRRVETL